MNKKEYDVIIVGGGTGGVCAAAALAGTGYKVAVIEENSALGGTTTEGGVSTWIEGVNLDFHREMFCHLKNTGNAEGELESSWLPTKFSDKTSNILKMNPLEIVEYYKKYFENVANVEVYYNSSFEFVTKMKSDAITEISVSVKGEKCLFSATFFIDSSGDGALCRSAGEYLGLPKESVYYIGRDAKSKFDESLAMSTDDPHQLNEPSLFFELVNSEVDTKIYSDITKVYAMCSNEKIDDDIFLNDDLFKGQYEDRLDKIRIVKPDYVNTDGYVDALKHDNEKIFFCNPMYGAGVTGYEYLHYPKELRYEYIKRKTSEYWKFIKYSLLLANRKGESGQWAGSGWYVSNCQFNMTGNFAPMCGVRESYRIKCRYMLSQNDLTSDVRECKELTEKRFIAIGSHNVDMHNQSGLSGIERFNQSKLKPYGIKYDSLVPSFLSNTLIGCKAFGASQIAVSSARTVKTVSQLGWASGNAIKLCLDEKLSSTALDNTQISQLQSEAYTAFTRYHNRIIQS